MKRLLYCGRLSPDKGILTALKAMLALKGRLACSLHVYGRGEIEYETMLRRYVEVHALPVTFHSACSEEMPEVYRQHDALLFTSEWEEPFALTPLEAMASGLPVIGTLTGGSAELFEHGKNALTYQAGDPQQLADNVLRLAVDSTLREQLARTGQKHVRERFNLPAIVSQIEGFLTESVQAWAHVNLPHYQAV